MISIYYFVLIVLQFVATTGQADAVDTDKEHGDAAGDLVFVPFEPFLPCGDGSPAGIYKDAASSASSKDKRDKNYNHVMVFLGGYGCTTKEQCKIAYEKSPQKLSSALWPRSLTGRSILSRNATENPVTDGFSRWLVPYCSQDLFLGKGGGNNDNATYNATEVTGFSMAGDAIFEAALNQLRDESLDVDSDKTVDTLVVAGISAGAIAVMNHMGSIRRMAKAANATRLRVILDSSDTGSQQTDELSHQFEQQQFEQGLGLLVDFAKHPLCNKTRTDSDFQANELWNVPCCISIHCMLDNDPHLQNWARTHDNDDAYDTYDERLLLLDSIYDPLGVLSSTRFIAEDPMLSNVDSLVVGLFETAGSRKQQILQSAYGSTSRLGDRVLWAVSNAVIHTTLIVAPEISTIACNYDEIDPMFSDWVTIVCKDNGYGYRIDLGFGLPVTAWVTTDTWELSMVNEEPVRSIIRRFVHDDDDDDSNSENTNVNSLHGLIWDACSGPNCIPSGATEGHPIQELFEIENDLVSISPEARLVILCALGCLGFLYFLRLVPVKLKSGRMHEAEATASHDDKEEVVVFESMHHEDSDSNASGELSRHRDSNNEGSHNKIINNNNINSANNEKNEAMWDTIVLKNVSVMVEKTDKALLRNISFKIVPGTITALFGPSGAGKTTLFNLLCGQLPSGLKGFEGFNKNREFDFLGIRTSYLRQFGNSSFQNIELDKYLRITARLYGVSETELANAISFLNRTFTDSVEKSADFGGILIKQLSGGQQRIVAIIATLFTRPKILLLDEPLSGLDSVSSIHVMQLLRELVAEISCSIILSIHQPSDTILEQTDNLIVLKGGVLVLNESFEGITKRGQSPAALIHDLFEDKKQKQRGVDKKTLFKSLSRRISLASFRTTAAVSERVAVRSLVRVVEVEEAEAQLGSNRWNTSERQPVESRPRGWRPWLSKTSFDLWQIQPLIRRIHLETGFQIFLILELPVCFLLASILFRFDEGPFQLLFVSVIFCVGPTLVYQPLLFDMCDMYQAHLLELEDGRISPTAFFLATFLIMFSMPIIMLPVALAIGFAVLGWDFDSYVDQYLFAALYLMVSLQAGRCLVIYVNGDRTICNQLYTLVAAFNGVMSGALISPNKVPIYIRWLFYFSTGFWSVSGISLVHFENGSLFDASVPCSSLHSCILQDGAFLGRYFGYTPISTSRLAYQVLLGCVAAFFLLEYAMMLRKHGAKRKLD